MTKYEDIFDIAADNHGLITSAQAREAGITNNELVQYAKRGRVTKVGHGLYQLTQWVPEQNDAYAWAVMSVGPRAVLYGESVIAMLGLAPTNPTRTFVATPAAAAARCRRTSRWNGWTESNRARYTTASHAKAHMMPSSHAKARCCRNAF